ncbi:shikimate dehydrogenase [Amorphus sp. 3PC139-8]|uniref:shikimate dehydrogenase n=1 Tax=Amorphus sp. 3PC139-8 TaxID=2735676 RepID=UPI00345CA356
MIDASPPRAGVIGWPVAHSRSPLIHGHWLKVYGLAGRYDAIAVSPDDAGRFFADFAESGLVGANVTIPHKITAAQSCDVLTATAAALGAVNTLWWEDGRLAGDNTDVHGFLMNLDDRAAGWQEPNRSALVIGAGGAARGVVHGLLSRGVGPIVVVNRSPGRAEQLAQSMTGIETADWSTLDGPLDRFSLIVNTTSLGMEGAGEVPIDLAGVQPDTVVADIVYVPLETGLLHSARKHGLRAVDGLGMLLHQAVPGFSRWFGVEPEVTEELRALVVADLARVT